MMVFFFSSRRRHTRCALVTGVRTGALPISGTALFGRRLGGSSDHADVGAVAGLAELHPALGDGEDRVIPAEADILARMHLGAALADDDVPGDDGLAPELLHAEATALGVAPVAGAAAGFLVRHRSISLSRGAQAPAVMPVTRSTVICWR